MFVNATLAMPRIEPAVEIIVGYFHILFMKEATTPRPVNVGLILSMIC